MLSHSPSTPHSGFSLSTLAGSAIATVTLLAFVFFGGPEALGAHPLWGMKIAYLGIAGGVLMSVLATFCGQRRALQLITFTTLLLISIAITTYGKTEFAASYAEDDFAGKLWFFGWIAALAASFSIIVAITPNRSRR